MAQPPTLPQVLAQQPVGAVQPVPSHLPPYLAPTSQVVAPAQLKPLQMPQPPLQPLAQVPPKVHLARSLLTLLRTWVAGSCIHQGLLAREVGLGHGVIPCVLHV